MSTKDEEIGLDTKDLDDLDLDFNFDDPDLTVDPLPKDRKPVKDMTKGFADAAKEELLNPNDLSRKLKEVLPDDYRTTVDLGDDLLTTGSSLYDTVVKETREGVRDFKRVSKRVVDKHGDKLPKWLLDKLGPMLETEDDARTLSREAIRDSEISSSLAQIFELQTKKDQGDREEDKVKDQVKEVKESRRFKTEIEELRALRNLVQRQVTYQDEINARYQRKSLELQYRQLFVSTDLLKLTEESSKDMKAALQAVVKNTALPEYQKIELSEAAGQKLREKLLGLAQGRVQEHFRGFWSRARDNLISKTRDAASQFGSALSGAAMGAETGMDIGETMEGLGGAAPSTANLAGQMVGGQAARFGFDKIAPKFAEFLQKNPEFAKNGAKAAMFTDSLPRYLNEWARRDHGTGVVGIAKNFLAESLGTSRLDPNVKGDNIEDSEKPAIYDRLTRRSIVEIIPGYLSRIHHEVETVRKGMGLKVTDSDRTVFNLKTGRFDTQSVLMDTLKSDIFKKENLERATEALESIYESIDPEKELSGTARKALGGYLLKDYFDGREFDITRLADANGYDESIPRDVADELASVIAKRFGVEGSYDDKGNYKATYKDSLSNINAVKNATLRFNRLGDSVQDPAALIEGYYQTGNRSALEALGIITRDSMGRGVIDYNKVFDVYQNGLGQGNVDSAKERAFAESNDLRYEANWEQKQKGTEESKSGDLLDSLKAKATKTGRQVKDVVTDKQAREELLERLKVEGEDVLEKVLDSELAHKVAESNVADVMAGMYKSGRDSVLKTVDEVQTSSVKQTIGERLRGLFKSSAEKIEEGANNAEDLKERVVQRLKGAIDASGIDGIDWSSIDGRWSRDSSMGIPGSDGSNVILTPTATNYSSSQGGEDDEVFASKKLALSDTLREIKEAMRSERSTLYDEVAAIRGNIDSLHGEDGNQANASLLSAILMNVESMALMMAKNDKESWLNIKDVSKKTGRMLGKVGGGLGNFYLGALKMFGGGMSGAGSIFSGLGRSIGRRLLSRSKGRTSESQAMDIYLKGRDEPALLAKDMEAGEYIDSETGKVIRTIADLRRLKGEIVNKAGDLIATPMDLSGGIYDRFGNRIGGEGLINGFKGLVSRTKNFVTSPYKYAGKLLVDSATGIYNKVNNLINKPQDVYVKGESQPRLLAVVMKNGGYISGNTGRTIYRLDQIDGDILDRNGNTVLSLHDMYAGLVDKDGHPLNFFEKQISRIKKLASGVLGLGKRGLVAMRKAGSKLMGGFGRAINRVTGGRFSGEAAEALVGNSDSQVMLLTQIRDILDERLEKDKRFDASGDGFRDGSWQERLANKGKKARDSLSKGKDGKGGKVGSFAATAAMLAGGGRNDNDEEESDDSGMSLSDALAAGEILAWGGRKLKRGAKAVGRGIKAVGGLGKKAITRLGGRALLSVGARVGMAAAGLVSLPALLTGAAVAAVGIGGYYLYKKLTEKDLGSIAKFRMMQYGIDPTNQDEISKIFYLEDKLFKHLNVSDSSVNLNLKAVNMVELAKGFGVDTEDKEQVDDFSVWFVQRFIPVFYAFGGALKTLKINKVDEDIDKLPVDRKKVIMEWLKRITDFANGGPHPYTVLTLPFQGKVSKIKESALSESLKDINSELEQETGKKENVSESHKARTRQTRNAETGRPEVESFSTLGKRLGDTTSVIDQRTRGRGQRHVNSFIQNQNKLQHSGGLFVGGMPVQHPGKGSGGDINELPLPSGDGSWDSYKELFAGVSQMTGVDAGLLATFAGIESNFNSRAKARTSSAKGLFQFIDGTWKDMLSEYGSKYGIAPGTSQYDPRANALMGAEFLRKNSEEIKGVLNREVTDTDLYLAHFLGAGGAKAFLASDPSERASSVLPGAAEANPSIFKRRGMAKTIAEVYQTLDKKVSVMRDHYANEARQVAQTFALNTDRDSSAEPSPFVLASTSEVLSTEGEDKQNNLIKKASFTGTPRQAVVTNVSMDSSKGISDVATGNIGSIQERRVNEIRQAAVNGAVQEKRSEEMNNNLSSVAGILNESLRIQQAMDNKLGLMVNLMAESFKMAMADKEPIEGETQNQTKPKLTRDLIKAAEKVAPSPVSLRRGKVI